MSLFPSIFCNIAAFSLNGEYVVRSFLPNGVFYLVTTGWIFDISLCENSIQFKFNSIQIQFNSNSIQFKFNSILELDLFKKIYERI